MSAAGLPVAGATRPTAAAMPATTRQRSRPVPGSDTVFNVG